MLDTSNSKVKRIELEFCNYVIMSLQTRINELFSDYEKRNGKPAKNADLARFVGCARATVTDWRNGNTKEINGTNAIRVARFFGASSEWVQIERGKKYATDQSEYASNTSIHAGMSDKSANATIVQSSSYTKPLQEYDNLAKGVDPVASGENFAKIFHGVFKMRDDGNGFAVNAAAGNGDPVHVRRAWMSSRKLHDNDLCAYTICGDAMAPTLYNADVILINVASNTPADGRVFAFMYENSIMIRRLQRDGGLWWLVADSPDKTRHQNKRFDPLICQIIGEVVLRQSDKI